MTSFKSGNNDREIEKIHCENCNTEIVEYHSEHYKGLRGCCPICGFDFPLD